MTADSPMSETESAHFAALLILVRAVTEASVDKVALADRFQAAAQSARAENLSSKAMSLEMFAGAADPARYPPLKPSFDVIPGGKE